MSSPNSIGYGKPIPLAPTNRHGYVVAFDGPDDALNPQNWSSTKKLFSAVIVCFGTFIATFDSAIYAAGNQQATHEFGVGNEVGILGTSCYVLGFAFGPVIWAPGSELVGRRWPLWIGMFGCSIFSIASATSQNIQTLVITRFFAGVFGASPLCVVPAILADFYDDLNRGISIAVYALTVFVGPFVAPFIGGFITMSSLGWRWTLYLPSILGLFDLALLVFLLDETYHPVILAGKASRIRREVGNWCIHAEHDLVEFDFRTVLQKYLTRPVRMLLTEPIVLLVSTYMSFIYGLVYALLVAYPFVFETVYGMNQGVAGLPFIALILGQLFAVAFIILRRKSTFDAAKQTGVKVEPETGLIPAIIGAFVFAGGLFWFAWTSYNRAIHWIVPVISGAAISFGLLCIFLPCFTYLVDAFLPLAASTIAANIILRSVIAAGFPLFARQMFENLGIQWAGTLLGGIAVVLIPIPLVFRSYGKSLRRRSRILNETHTTVIVKKGEA